MSTTVPSTMSTKAERLAVVSKTIAAVNSGKESDIEAAFATDFKFIIPGTGGRESHGVPTPPGIDGKSTSYSLSKFLHQAQRLSSQQFTKHSRISNFML